jgi:energy-coupling factor transporter ATP-binding protein EcfA2
MTTPTLEGLRLAFQDGELSVRRESVDPNQHAPTIIESITIAQGRYVGRQTDFELRFNPWLNAIIGGRGTGKSTVVELLRAALRRERELPRRLSDNWKEMVQVPRARGERGVLTEKTHVTVIYRKDGARFRIQWNPAGSATPIEVQQPDGFWARSEGHVVDRFPVRIYSQKQVFELTEEPEALLRIVDEAPQVDSRGWQEAWNAEEGRFLSLRAQAREVDSSLADESRAHGELDDVQRQLAVFEKAGHAELLRRWQVRRRQQRAIEDWAQSLAETTSRMEDLAKSLTTGSVDSTAIDTADAAATALLSSIAEVETQVAELREEASTVAARMSAIRDAWPGLLARSPWRAAVNEADTAYDTLIEELRAAGGRDPSQYGQLVQQRQLLEKQLATFVGKRNALAALEKQAQESLERLTALRQDRSRRRSAFLSAVLADNPFVRIEVVPLGATAGLATELRRLFGREDAAFPKDLGEPGERGTLVGDLVGSYPRAFESADDAERVALSAAFYDRLATLKQELWAIRQGSRPPAHQSFATFLSGRPPEQMDRLDAWFPADTLQVLFQGRGCCGFQPISQGSPGQRSAALLAFLLSHGTEPIVMDQPEDDLDNQLVYDLIVQQIRRIKGSRQVLVVTHNANIVVNGDAEYVVALNVPAGEVLVEKAGGLQEQAVRDVICRVMEGGAEAFRERFRRIAAGAGDV